MHLPGRSVGFPVGVLCGMVGESHWWDIWWAAGLVGNLVGACGCWSGVAFPCWGPACVGLVGLGVWSFLGASPLR